MVSFLRFLPRRWWKLSAWRNWRSYIHWRLATYGVYYPDGKLHAKALRSLARQLPSYRRWLASIDRLRKKSEIAKAFVLAWTVLSIFASCALAAGPKLTLGEASGKAGATVSLPVSFDPSTASVAAVEFDLVLPKGLSRRGSVPGKALLDAGKTVAQNMVGDHWRFIVIGMNANKIGKGPLLTTQLSIASGMAPGTVKLRIAGASFADPQGRTVAPGSITGGSVKVTK